MVALRRVGLDQEWYDVSHLPSRAAHPQRGDGAALALSVIVSLSYFEDVPPEGSVRPLDLSGGLSRMSVPPQYAQLSCREYGLRVGFFRLVRALESVGITPAIAIDVMTAEEYPFLVEYCLEHKYELVAHGISATQPITSAMSLDTERHYLADCLRRFQYATGQIPSGWFGASWSESERTPALLRELGLRYLCDWPNDEQPYLMTGAAKGLVSLPMMFEFDDNYSFVIRDQSVTEYAIALARGAERLIKEGEAAPRFLGLSLSSWISGQGWRVGAIAKALGMIAANPKVVVSSPGEVATWTVSETNA